MSDPKQEEAEAARKQAEVAAFVHSAQRSMVWRLHVVLRTTCSLWIAQEEEKAARRRMEVQVVPYMVGLSV